MTNNSIKTFPISCSELINKLNNCTKNTLGDLGFPNLKNSSTTSLKIFLDAIAYPTQSYTDVNTDNQKQLLGHILKLFPADKRSDEDRKCFVAFLSTLTKKAPSEPPIPTYGKESFETYLECAKSYLKPTPEKRLENIYTLVKKEKIATLQLILNDLLVDEEFNLILAEYVKAVFDCYNLQKKYLTGCEKTIRLNGYQEAILFKISQKIESTEEFALWLQLAPHIGLQYDEDILYAVIKPSEATSIPKLTEKLTQLKESTKNERTRFVIDKYLTSIELNKVSRKMVDRYLLLPKWMSKLDKTQYCNITDSQLESYTTPSYYNSVAIYRKIQEESFAVVFEDYAVPKHINIHYYHHYKQLLDLWVKHRTAQQKLYALAYQELQTIINQTEKHKKRDILQYSKNISSVDGSSKALPEQLELKSLSEELHKFFGLPIPVKPAQENLGWKVPSLKIETTTPSQPRSRPNREDVVKNEKLENIEKNVSDPAPLEPKTPSIETKFPFQYTSRVTRWLKHEHGKPLPADQFPEYASQSLEKQQLEHAFHAFSPIVDKYLHLAIQGCWKTAQGKEYQGHVFVAQITYQKKKYRGVISYGSNKECFHRYFSTQTDHYILHKKVEQKLNESDFPNHDGASGDIEAYTPTAFSGVSVSVNPAKGFIKIKDQAMHMTIKLFVDLN